MLLFLDEWGRFFVLLFWLFELGFHCVTLAGLEFTLQTKIKLKVILLPLSPLCYNYSHVPPCLAQLYISKNMGQGYVERMLRGPSKQLRG